MTNLEIVRLLQKIAVSYQISGENRFKIMAYEKAADSIKNLSLEVKDLWKKGSLDQIPGIGHTIASHLDELFMTGQVKHFKDVLGRLPENIFILLEVPGIGPRKAYKLIEELKLKDTLDIVKELENACKNHLVASIDGFGDKSEQLILESIQIYKKGLIKENRLLLFEADRMADEIIKYLLKCRFVLRADILGSLRRKCPTIGDIDIAAASVKADQVIEHFILYPHLRIIEKGRGGSSMLLANGRQVDLRVIEPDSYGSMLQYFTGSKNHNIRLRSRALDLGFSLSEYGLKNLKTGNFHKYSDETDLYKALGMDYIEPELREDWGEVETASVHNLPKLIKAEHINGDLHIHTSYDLESSHDLGKNNLYEYLLKAENYRYEYIGISDHNPSQLNHSDSQINDILKARKLYYENIYYSKYSKIKKRVHLLIMLEVDILPDGSIPLPDKAFEYLDAVIVSVHSVFNKSRSEMTKRVVRALQAHPKIRILGHPTGRLLGKRQGFELDWDKIFEICKLRDIAIEINSHPVRLDLPDFLVREAIKNNVKLVINTDAHDLVGMEMMKYGVEVSRRGWAEKDDIINSLGYNEFTAWLKGDKKI